MDIREESFAKKKVHCEQIDTQIMLNNLAANLLILELNSLLENEWMNEWNEFILDLLNILHIHFLDLESM